MTQEASTETQTSTETPTTETTSTTEAQSTDQSSSSTIDLAATGEEQTDEQQTQEQQEDTRTDEQRTADEAREALFGAPAEGESYAVEGLPEGMEIDKEALDAVAPVARELNLSNQGLSRIAAVYAEKVLPGVMQRTTSSIEQQVVAQRTAWEGEAKDAIKSNGSELKNVAGETLSFDAKDEPGVLKTAAKALDRLAPQGFRDFLKDTGLAQHPAMVAFAYQAGKLLAEDTDLESADNGSNKPKSRVEKYYGS